MKEDLIEFFNSRSNVVKSVGGFPKNTEEKFVAKYKFIVSNYKQDEDNTIEVKSLKVLNTSIKNYFLDTPTDYKEQIELSEGLDETKKMFVHLMLEI